MIVFNHGVETARASARVEKFTLNGGERFITDHYHKVPHLRFQTENNSAFPHLKLKLTGTEIEEDKQNSNRGFFTLCGKTTLADILACERIVRKVGVGQQWIG